LETYANDTRVMSVAAWTHPAVRPSITNDQPYFDGRFACWGWGTWRRAWQGMDRSALELMQQCRRPDRYGQDLVHMARHEIAANLWAVRFAMLHFLRKGLCLHPPETMVVNIGFDEFGTNIKSDQTWRQEIPERTPAIPDVWPIPLEHPDAAALWRKVCGEQSPLLHDIRRAVSRKLARIWYGCRLMTDFSGLHSHYLRRAVRDACRRLSEKQISVAIDYGCGERPYDNELRSIAGKVVGLDLGENPLADIRIDPKGSIPIQSASVSLVTTFQVLEHVPDPTSYLGEIGRVCRCGGHLLLSVPSIWPYHPHPTDFRRWMIDGLVYDLRTAGFEVEQTWSVLNPVSATIQYILAIAQYATMRWNRWVRPWTIPAVVFLNVMIVLSEKIFQRSMRYGAGNYVVLARRVPDNS
jgi:2-polyprenyl-3-methyl-5-hydroxy-6-metoxy-1,4-benzoquinol methylase